MMGIRIKNPRRDWKDTIAGRSLHETDSYLVSREPKGSPSIARSNLECEVRVKS